MLYEVITPQKGVSSGILYPHRRSRPRDNRPAINGKGEADPRRVVDAVQVHAEAGPLCRGQVVEGFQDRGGPHLIVGTQASADVLDIRPVVVPVELPGVAPRITSYNVCYTKLLRKMAPTRRAIPTS